MQYVEMVLEAFRVPSEPSAPQGSISFKVRVLSSPAGELSNAEAVVGSFVEQDLRGSVEKIRARALQANDGGVDLVAFGRQLAGWLLPAGAIRDLYARSLELAGQDGGLRLRLRLSPKLAWIPWEYLYVDPPGGGGQRDGFLALNQRVAIVRHEALPQTLPRVQPPPDATLKVAAAMALAADRDQLDLSGEQKSLEAIFSTKGVEGRFLEGATIQDILNNLQDDAHVFHFSGHGAFARAAASVSTYVGTGIQEMEDGSLVGADQLSLNVRSPSLRLAVIGACDSGSRGDIWAENPWGGTATMLAKVGVPAVIGNQFTIRDDCAIAFSKAFYTALFGGLPIEQAVAIGRVAISNADKDGRDWGVPVLYMRAPDGQLFNGVTDRATREKARREAESYIEQRVEVRGDNNVVQQTTQNISKNVQGDDVRGDKKTYIYNIAAAHEETDLTPRPPQVPAQYVNREETERELREALIGTTDDAPVVVLAGRFNMGKGHLALHVVNQIASRFEGGVIWSDYAGRRVEELVRWCAGELGSKWAQQAASGVESFWQTLRIRGRPTLLVILNVPEKEIKRLIPPPSMRGNSRLLIVADAAEIGGDSLKIDGVSRCCYVGPFNEEQTEMLFRKMLGEPVAKKYHNELIAIAELYDYTPPEIFRAASNLVASKLNPATFLDRLRATTNQNTSLDDARLQQQDVYIQDLTSVQADLFNLTYLLGAGDWSASMLAAISLTPIKQVRAALDALERRALVTRTPSGRYRNDGSMREVVKRRFEARPEYERRAAYHLRARACISIAQDLQEKLRHQRLRDGEEKFYTTFRDQLAPEVPHIRSVIEWAAAPQQGYWEIIRRFSSLPYMGLVRHLVGKSQRIYLDLQMATIDGLVLGLGIDKQEFDAAALAFVSGAGGLGVVVAKANQSGEAAAEIERHVRGEPASRIELHLQQATSQNEKIQGWLQLRAGRIVNGIIADADLDYVNWIGVYAHRFIWRNAELANARFVACNMLQSVWLQCDASRVTLAGSDLSNAIFTGRTSLRGADLSGADLSGAIFDGVEMRDAILAGANLTGAILNNVSLMRAQLDGANLTGAMLNDVRMMGAHLDGANLAGASLAHVDLSEASLCGVNFACAEFGEKVNMARANLDGAIWSGVRGEQPRLDEGQDELFEQGRQTQVDPPALPRPIYDWIPPSRDLRFGGDCPPITFSKADLRAADLTNVSFDHSKFVDGDFRSAMLNFAHLDEVKLVKADLSAVSLDCALIDGTELDRAQMSGARMANALIVRADLHGAKLYAAGLSNALLDRTNLRGADLRFARLDGASLVGVDLTDAQLADETTPEKTEAILRTLRRLRGSTLPNGKRYAGQFDLLGDRADAELIGCDLSNPEAAKKFYRTAPSESPIETALRHVVSVALWPDTTLEASGPAASEEIDAIATIADEIRQVVQQAYEPNADPDAVRQAAEQVQSKAQQSQISTLWPIAVYLMPKSIAPQIMKAAIRRTRQQLKRLGSVSAARRQKLAEILAALAEELDRGAAFDAAKLTSQLHELYDIPADISDALCAHLVSPALRYTPRVQSIAAEAPAFILLRASLEARAARRQAIDAGAEALWQIHAWRTNDEELAPLIQRLAKLERRAAGMLDALLAAIEGLPEVAGSEIGTTIRGMVAETRQQIQPLAPAPAAAVQASNGTAPAG